MRNVDAMPKYSFADGVLTYEVERRHEIVNLILTGAGSYSPEDSLNGSLTFTADNVLRRSESLSLSLTGGEFASGRQSLVFRFLVRRRK